MAAIKGYLNSLVENKRKTTPTRKRVPHCQLFNSFLRQDKSLLKYIISVGTFYILSLFRSYSINIKLESFLYTFDIAFNYIRKMKSMIIQFCVCMGKVTLDIYELFFTLWLGTQDVLQALVPPLYKYISKLLKNCINIYVLMCSWRSSN